VVVAIVADKPLACRAIIDAPGTFLVRVPDDR